MSGAYSTVLLLPMVLLCVDASDHRSEPMLVTVDKRNLALHFNSSEEDANEVFSKIYNNLFQEDGTLKTKRVANDPDSIQCYKGKGIDESGTISFDFTDLHTQYGQVMQKVEIRLKLTIPTSKRSHLASLYDVMTKEKLSHANIAPGASQQWLTFPGTPVLYKWLQKPRTSYCVQLVVTEEKIDGVLRLSNEKERGVFYLPLLVIYTASLLPVTTGRQQGRDRRSEEESSMGKITCSKGDLFLNTSEVFGDSVHVVYPLAYNAYTCAGNCERPFGDNYNRDSFTNYALVRYRFHTLQNKTHRSFNVFCVPFSYKSLAVMHYVNEAKTQIAIRTFPEMIIAKCKCAISEKPQN